MAQAKKGTTSKAKKSTAKKPAVKKAATRKPADKSGYAFTLITGQENTSKTMENIMTQGKSQFDKFTGDATKTSKEQMDAYMKSGNIFMKGFEDYAKTYMSWAQSSTEKNAQAVKALLSCKSINEYTETQNKWVQQNFDDFMAGATKLSELGVKVTTDALEPINDQFSKSIKKAAETLVA